MASLLLRSKKLANVYKANKEKWGTKLATELMLRTRSVMTGIQGN